MKRIFSILLGCLTFMSVVGQKNSVIEVSYCYQHPVQTMRSAVPDVENRYVLITDGHKSKFYSPKTEMIDSIESTPEGFEAFNTYKRKIWESGNRELFPRVDGSFYVTKSIEKGKLKTYDVASATRFCMEESLPEIEWEICDSIKNILGYDCQLATTVYHGRKWNAWFTPDVPIQEGPWKLSGLPGIIMEASCEGGQYSFIADGLQFSSRQVVDVYGKEKWDPISRTEFWQLRRSCLDNPSRNINSNGGNVIVFNGIKYEKYLPKEVVDYIETDY